MGCVSKFPDRAKWAAQGPRRRKSVHSRRVHPGSISGSVMATWYLRGILTTHSRSPLKMQRFEPSIDLDFANSLFEKGWQLNYYFFGTFQPSSMRPRDTVEMQGFELVAILVATSDLLKLFWGPLRAPKEPSGMENWSRDPWVTPSPPARQIVSIFTNDSGQKCLGLCKYAAILAVEFHPVKMESIWPAALPRATRGRPRSRKQLFKKAPQLRRLFLKLFCPQRRGHETP